MKSTSFRLGAAGLATAILLGSAVSANAAPLFAGREPVASANIIKVQRDGHRRYRGNDWGPPAAALLGGLVIGGIIANSARPAPAYAYPAYPAPAYSRNPHADWCAANTPGYNPYDNTSQGYYAGERVYCRSPYGG